MLSTQIFSELLCHQMLSPTLTGVRVALAVLLGTKGFGLLAMFTTLNITMLVQGVVYKPCVEVLKGVCSGWGEGRKT